MRFNAGIWDIDPGKYPKAVRQKIAANQKAALQAKRDYEERIRPLLPLSLQRLQAIPWGHINDGAIRKLEINTLNQSVDFCLLCGDNPSGYFDLNLHYKDVELDEQIVKILCFLAHDGAEVSSHEIDLEEAEPPLFKHCILWNTKVQTGAEEREGMKLLHYLQPETELRFGGFEMEIVSPPKGSRNDGKAKISVVSAPPELPGFDFL